MRHKFITVFAPVAAAFVAGNVFADGCVATCYGREGDSPVGSYECLVTSYSYFDYTKGQKRTISCPEDRELKYLPSVSRNFVTGEAIVTSCPLMRLPDRLAQNGWTIGSLQQCTSNGWVAIPEKDQDTLPNFGGQGGS